MKKTLLFSSIICVISFSCEDKEASPVPPKIEGKWNFDRVDTYCKYSTDSIFKYYTMLKMTNAYFEFEPNSSNLNFYMSGKLAEKGQYNFNNNILTITLDTLSMNQNTLLYIDSLTSKRLVFRDSTIHTSASVCPFGVFRLYR